MRTLKTFLIFSLVVSGIIFGATNKGNAYTIDQYGVIEIKCSIGKRHDRTYFYPPTGRISTLHSRGNHELFLTTHRVHWPILTDVKIYQYQDNEWQLVQKIAQITYQGLAKREDMDSTRFGISAEENLALGKCLESEFSKSMKEYRKLYGKW